VTYLSRRASSLVLALAASLGFATFASAETSLLPVLRESETGSFLAGQQALADLHTADAAQYFSNAAKDDWDNPVLVDRAFFALGADGQVERAAETARHLLEIDPDNEMAKLVIATHELKNGQFPAAMDQLEGMGTDSFGGITGSILRAWALIGDGKTDAALALMDQIGADGLEEFLYFHKALMLDIAGKTDAAIESARLAYETDPLDVRLVEAYVRMLGNAGRFDDATAIITEYEADGRTYPLIDAVEASIKAGMAPGPFATSVQVGAAEMFQGVGFALARDGGRDYAVFFLQMAKYLSPEADVIDLTIGQILDLAGQYELANRVYEAVPQSSPLKPTAALQVAENFDAMGDRDEAIRRLNNIVVSRPDDLDAVSVLGDMLRSDERYAEAAEAYTKALELTPGDGAGDWRFYYVRGIAYERAKEWPKAESDFLKALDLNPNQPQVLNYLGYSWVDQGTNLDRALDMIQRAVSASPNDGYIIDSLGWAFFRLGRFEDAVEVLEQAVQLLPNDPEINDHLGDAYWRAGRTLEAKFQWNVASSVDDVGNVRTRVQPKLAGGLDSAPVTEDSAPVEDTTVVTQ
jgi:tetratricopeptide (TPR) repeat protein